MAKINVPKKTVLLFAIILAVIATLIFSLKIAKKIKETNAHKPITYSTSHPSETPIDKNTYDWNGYPDEPKYITLPTIKGEGYIAKVGVDQNNQIAVPASIYVGGWFYKTSIPGHLGLSIIDGHVSGQVNIGIFKNLSKLQPGDKFYVTLGNGRDEHYSVIKIFQVPVSTTPSVLFSQLAGVKSQLNLVTCGGKFNYATKSYPDRIVVYSELSNN